jgi:acrylyl-CoA reductase (NADPH)
MQLDNLTVLPFILRGINLLGIDSVQISLKEKVHIWNKLATKWKCAKVEDSVIDIGRNELDTHLKLMLNGNSSGKIVLDHSLTKTATTKTNGKSKL